MHGKCDAKDCEVEFINPYDIYEDRKACSARCFGSLLAEVFDESQNSGAGSKSKVRQLQEVRPLPSAIPYVPMPEDKIAKGIKTPRLSVVQFNRNIYKAWEIIVLVKVTHDLPIRTFAVMRDVYAYTDKNMGLLLRPNMGGVKPTFQDVPRAIAIAAKSLRKRHKAGREEAKQEVKAQKRLERIHALKYAPVEGASYGNPSVDNKSKRFFMIESMLLGGTAKEIIERADIMAHKSGVYRRGDITRSIPSNPANVRAQFERVKGIWHKQGIVGKAIEKDGVWRVELVKK